MSTPLTTWLKDHISKLYELPSLADPDTAHADFDSNFDEAFSSTAQITINGDDVPRDKLKEEFSSQKFAATHISLEWKDVIEVPKHGEGEGGGSDAGIVAGVLVATRTLRFRVRAAPAQNQTISVFHAHIESGTSVTVGDRRRIVRLYETVLNKNVAVNLNPLGAS